MILVFGGTTEGRKAVKELDEAGQTYYYSTKTDEQDVTMHHGIRLTGAMVREDMLAFCRTHGIRLIIDAAHPFAEHLHSTVASVAAELGIPAIRFERIFPEHGDKAITWCASYDDAVQRIINEGVHSLFATTGVQGIGKLKPLEQAGIHCWYRILQRQSSIDLAHSQGAADEQLVFYDSNQTDEHELLSQLKPDAILLKESGETGGFSNKVRAAEDLGIRIFALTCPPTPPYFHRVNGEHGLRRMVEKLLPDFYKLHSGLTTGTYATATSLAAALRLLKAECPAEVQVLLPDGETILVPVEYHDGYVSAYKDSGDDPDVTNGVEIRSSVETVADGTQPVGETADGIEICGGTGVGIITFPGFDYPPGSPAINKVPRQMIRQNINRNIDLQRVVPRGSHLRVTVSVPAGVELAHRTFNPRLGIEGGISIVGVSGIIKPFSEEGFLNSIRKCMEVAKATGCDRVVINSGAKSEAYVKAAYPDLPPQVFVEYGNFIGGTIKLAADEGFPYVTLGVMLGKAIKLAAGNLDTHSHKTVMDKDFICQLLAQCGCDEQVQQQARRMTLARELWTIVPPDKLQAFASAVISCCHKYCDPLLPNGQLTILLIDDNGKIYR